MTRRSCAVGMRNAILMNYLKAKRNFALHVMNESRRAYYKQYMTRTVLTREGFFGTVNAF